MSSIESIKIGRADLQYKTADIQEWTRMTDPHGAARFNCKKLVFSGGLSLRQGMNDNHGFCTVAVRLSSPQVAVDKFHNVTLEGACQKTLACTFQSESGDATSGDSAVHQFPIAITHQNWTAVKIHIPVGEVRKVLGGTETRIWANNLCILAAEESRKSSANDSKMFIKEVFDILMKESKAQAELLKLEEGCRIETTVVQGNKVVVSVWPRYNCEEKDDKINGSPYAQRYIVKSNTLFKKEDVRKNPIFGNPVTEDWEMVVVTKESNPRFWSPKWKAPLIGVIQNSIKDLHEFSSGLEDNVILVPIFDDVLGDRARAFVKELAEEFEAQREEAMVIMIDNGDSKKALSMLPTCMMFLKEVPYNVQANKIDGIDGSRYAAHLQGMYEAQQVAIRRALTHKVSNINGPAATGKSETLAKLILIMASMSYKVLVTALTNVAVDSLCERTGNMVCQFVNIPPRAIARLWTPSQVRAQYSSGQSSLIKSGYHIENLRRHLAAGGPGRKTSEGFLKGCQELMAQGTIRDKKTAEDYERESYNFTRQVLNDARVVFCTTAALRSSTLGPKIDGKRVWWPAHMCIIDEAGCANPGEVVIPVMTYKETLKQLVLAGDPRQLPPYAITPEGKAFYKVSPLQLLIKSNFPETLLNLQFRTHNEAYDPVGNVVYFDQVKSNIKTSSPPTALQSLLNGLLLTISIKDKLFKIPGFLNFLTVDGESVTDFRKSSSNATEVIAVEELVKGLMRMGKKDSEICVMTGYRGQLKELRVRANFKEWSGVNICTIDTAQGREWDIVILSLVKTNGDLGFIGQMSRANVACSRHRSALYLVGNWDFWISTHNLGNKFIGTLIRRMRTMRGETFVVR